MAAAVDRHLDAVLVGRVDLVSQGARGRVDGRIEDAALEVEG